MNKKAYTELKKTLKSGNSGFRRMFAYYMPLSGDPTKLNVEKFLTKNDDEIEMYFGAFKKILSGTPGKQLLMGDFNNTSEENGMQKKLYDLIKVKEADEVVEEIIAAIAENYHAEDPYILLIMQAAYDVYDKETDNSETFDHLICAACPVEQGKSNLTFNGKEIIFMNGKSVLKNPEFGFLFPAFIDRAADIHQISIYHKKYSMPVREALTTLFDCRLPIPVEEQKQVFAGLAESAFGGKCDFGEASYVQSALLDRANADETTIGPKQLKDIFEEAGATEFNDEFDESVELLDGHDINIENIVNKKKVVIEAGDVTITAAADMMSNIRVKTIDGQQMIVIEPRENVVINGLKTAEN